MLFLAEFAKMTQEQFVAFEYMFPTRNLFVWF